MLHVIGLNDFISYPSGIWMDSTWLFVAMVWELLHRCSFRVWISWWCLLDSFVLLLLWGWYPWFTDVLNEILLCVMWSCELWLSVTPFPSSMCLVCMECPSCSSFWLTVIFSFSVVSLTPYSHFLPCDSSHSRDDWVDLCPVNTRIVNNSNSECGILNSSNSVRVTASSLYRNDFTVMIIQGSFYWILVIFCPCKFCSPGLY